MTDSQVGALRSLAGFFRQEQPRLIDTWMKAVASDVDLVEADSLTRAQLADHLPAILNSICAALEEQDLEPVEPVIERHARQHGNIRWQQRLPY